MMAIRLKVKTIQAYTNAAAKRSGVYRGGRRFTTHSNRKAYSQGLYDSSRNMKEQSQGSNREQIVERMKNELERINTYRIKNGMDRRPFSQEQLRCMLDVVLSYINPDKSRRG